MSWDWLQPALAVGGAVAGGVVGGPAGAGLGMQLGSTVGGAIAGSNANSSAADKASAATLEGARIHAAALREQQAKLDAYREEMRPGDDYLRKAVAEEGSLTPAQRLQLNDLRRTTSNNIRTSAIAGSGRTASALLNDTENRFTVNALDTNRNRGFTAATGMATRGGNALTRSADVSGDIGRVSGDAFTKAGMFGPQADLANASLQGRAIGDVGSLIAKQGRPSSFGNLGKNADSNWGGTAGGTGGNLGGLY